MENITEMILSGKDLSEIENTKRVNALMDQAASEWEMDWVFE